MPIEALALDIHDVSAERWEIAVHPVGEPEAGGHLLLLGYDAVATMALANSLPDATVTSLDSLDEAAAALAALGGDAPWLTFGQFGLVDAWAEADGSGVLGAVPLLDVGELAALALPCLEARELRPFLTALGLDAASDTPGLPRARAVATLWEALAKAIAGRPYAVRRGLGDLLYNAGHPLAAAWRAAAGGEPVGEEPALLDSLLRQRLARLTPPAGEPGDLPETKPIDTAEVASWFAPDGPLAAQMAAYERRDGQVAMAVAVAEALNGGQCLLVEAGTGTGKSIAYLAPALKFAVQNQTPVVVSTNTKNLQDQLRSKDLPLLAKVLPFEFQAELIKGRGNYLCVEKLLGELADVGLLPFDDQVFHLAYLLSWAAETPDGDLDNLSGYLTWKSPHLDRYARNLASDSESCTANSARNHPCFATAARRRAMSADLLVINHALALANATVEVLPPFQHLIVDEAHNLEDIATEAFGLSLDRRGLQSLARELASGRQARSVTQRVGRLLDEVAADGATELREMLHQAENLAEQVIQATDDYGEQLSGWLMQLKQLDRDDLARAERMRLDPTLYDGPLGPSLRVAADNLHGRMTELGECGKRLMLALTAMSSEAGEELNQVKQAAQARFADWSEQLRALTLLRELSDEKYVYWLEVAWRQDRWHWRLRAAPIEAGDALAEQVWSRMAAVAMTSATLTVRGEFGYFARRLGLTHPAVSDRARELVVPSSFDYPRQVLLGMPDNIALPNEAAFENHVARAIDDIAKQLDGRTLVLFTSLTAMRNVYYQLEARLEAIGIEPLCQTISGPRHALAERFRSNPHAVLFGTRSFWEGIDVPGDALQCVVLVKLPFTVPDDPVFLARCERLEADGLNAWASYAVPQAVILFKQGFGRLIRTSTDRGVVLCLDRRLREKSYGRAFLSSVPGYTAAGGSWSQIKAQVQSWLAPPSPSPAAERKRS